MVEVLARATAAAAAAAVLAVVVVVVDVFQIGYSCLGRFNP